MVSAGDFGAHETIQADALLCGFTLTGGALAGSSVLVDDAGTESIVVDFSFALPAELVEC